MNNNIMPQLRLNDNNTYISSINVSREVYSENAMDEEGSTGRVTSKRPKTFIIKKYKHKKVCIPSFIVSKY